MSLRELILERIRETGPLTFAEYMDLALYHPELGYYARADRRSGRAGDFFTSVDVGPVFGELLAEQIAEMGRLIAGLTASAETTAVKKPCATAAAPKTFDLVEAGAGSGRLARDVLDALAARHADVYETTRLHLVERSAAARAGHARMLGPHGGRLASSGETLPDMVDGIVYANELLDAMPVHSVVMTPAGIREVYVDEAGGRLVERPETPSTPALAAYFDRLGLQPPPGSRTEVGLAASAWLQSVARRLRRGFLLLVDYGHTADRLYGGSHAAGTLRAYRRHAVSESAAAGPAWLDEPGEHDLTAHVDLTTQQRVAESEGLEVLGVADQMYFLMGLGAADVVTAGQDVESIRRRLALKSLLLPDGLGSTHKVLVCARNVGRPALRGLSFGHRVS